jgi:hypothetical protein
MAKDHDGLPKITPLWRAFFVNGRWKTYSSKVQLTNNTIIAFIKVNGEINISIDGLN